MLHGLIMRDVLTEEKCQFASWIFQLFNINISGVRQGRRRRVLTTTVGDGSGSVWRATVIDVLRRDSGGDMRHVRTKYRRRAWRLLCRRVEVNPKFAFFIRIPGSGGRRRRRHDVEGVVDSMASQGVAIDARGGDGGRRRTSWSDHRVDAGDVEGTGA
jgi:hypothetical protein